MKEITNLIKAFVDHAEEIEEEYRIYRMDRGVCFELQVTRNERTYIRWASVAKAQFGDTFGTALGYRQDATRTSMLVYVPPPEAALEMDNALETARYIWHYLVVGAI